MTRRGPVLTSLTGLSLSISSRRRNVLSSYTGYDGGRVGAARLVPRDVSRGGVDVQPGWLLTMDRAPEGGVTGTGRAVARRGCQTVEHAADGGVGGEGDGMWEVADAAACGRWQRRCGSKRRGAGSGGERATAAALGAAVPGAVGRHASQTTSGPAMAALAAAGAAGAAGAAAAVGAVARSSARSSSRIRPFASPSSPSSRLTVCHRQAVRGGGCAEVVCVGKWHVSG